MHILPQLRKLERKYHNDLIVIGVHSAKFPSEKETPNVRKAMLRYGVDHPVVNDRDFQVWNEYTVRAWPTLMFIDPNGKVIGKLEGEFPVEAVDQVISAMLAEFEEAGALDHRPIEFQMEEEGKETLSFPGKVLADADANRLYISDSNHDRILVTDLDGNLLHVAGSGQIGLRDGSLAEAQFNRPQGLAASGDVLYVADTENHAIRRVDLARGTVETLAGTGEQQLGPPKQGPAHGAALNSPWDLWLDGDRLIIAMAGSHQLWTLHLTAGTLDIFAGSGSEGLRDGPARTASLAQTSGLTSDGRYLYFADSETSSVRRTPLDGKGDVRTLVGQGLFEFGDVDGMGNEVRLQHPLGLAYSRADSVLYVADAYNNKVKTLGPENRTARTLLGSGARGLRDGRGTEAELYEPGGLSVAGRKLYIADTNNHAIRVADLDTLEVRTLEIRGMP